MKLVRTLELEVRGTTNWQILSPRPLLLRNSAEPALASLEECDKHHLREPVMRCSKKAKWAYSTEKQAINEIRTVCGIKITRQVNIRELKT